MARKVIRPFATLPSTALADGIGALDVQLRDLQTKMKNLKAKWIARKLVRVEGTAFTMLCSPVERETFNIAAATAALGEKVLAPYYHENISQKFTIKASEQLAQAA
jgi:hypothetical protein